MKIPIPKTDRRLTISLNKTVFSQINSTGDRLSDWFKIQLITHPMQRGRTLKINLGETELAIAVLPKTEDERFHSIEIYPWRMDVFKGDRLLFRGGADGLTFAQAFVQAGRLKKRFISGDRVVITPLIIEAKVDKAIVDQQIQHLTATL